MKNGEKGVKFLKESQESCCRLLLLVLAEAGKNKEKNSKGIFCIFSGIFLWWNKQKSCVEGCQLAKYSPRRGALGKKGVICFCCTEASAAEVKNAKKWSCQTPFLLLFHIFFRRLLTPYNYKNVYVLQWSSSTVLFLLLSCKNIIHFFHPTKQT